jgi:hypothetical protein
MRLTRSLAWLLCASLSATSIASASSQTPIAPGPIRVVDTGELMQLFIRPAYQELQAAMMKPPTSRQEWAAIYRAAVRLAEMENLIFFREPNRYTSQPQFPLLTARARDTTAEVVRLTLTAMPGAKEEDLPAIRRAYEAVSTSCTACHRGLGTMNGPTVKP